MLRGQHLAYDELCATAMLKVQQKIIWTSFNVKVSGTNSEMLWDRYCPMMEDIVSFAATALDIDLALYDENIPPPARSPVFSLDLGIVPPLFDVACRCRDPVIRRRAAWLLHASPRQEGIWSSTLAARVVERVIQIEEQGLGNVQGYCDVPEAARISEIKFTFTMEGRRADLWYSRPGRLPENELESIKEVLEW